MKEIFERKSIPAGHPVIHALRADCASHKKGIRQYTGEPVSAGEVETLLRAAMRAPSAGNEQPWEFVVLRDRETMEKILDFHPYATPLRTAACAVVVCGDTAKQKFPQDYWVQDCSAAAENLLLEAEHLGLGAVWLGVYPAEERVKGIQELLGLPKTVLPLCVVAVGRTAVHPAAADTYRPERVHQERWE